MVQIPTFRLFVQHRRALSSFQEEKDLRALFELQGKVISFSTKKDWRNSLVSFATIQEAIAARKALDDTRFNGERLKINFTRPTRRVLARGLPSIDEARKIFPTATRIERDSGNDFAVVFETVRDAEQAVAGRDLNIDFGNDTRGRERRRSAERLPSPRARRSRSPEKRTRNRSASRERDRSPEIQSSPRRSPEKRSRSRSSPLRKRFRSPKSPRRSSSSSSSSSSPSRRSKSRSPSVADDGSCRDCSRHLRDLTEHVKTTHSPGPVADQKAVILAWFECHYTKKEDGGVGEIPVYVSRSTILNELNALLSFMGWQKWKAQSALYRDWFLREVMGLDDDDIRKGRNWSLYRKDGFAPGSSVKNARAQQQRMEELVVNLKKYMGL